MTTTKLGKVCITPKGDYSPTAVYENLDVVRFEGNGYISLKDNNIGNSPTDVSCWAPLCSRGDSAYEHAVSNGYNYSQEKFAADCTEVANYGARLSAIESSFIGKQCGFTGTSFSSKNSALMFSGVRTTEIIFKTGASVSFDSPVRLYQFGTNSSSGWSCALYLYGENNLMYTGYRISSISPNTLYHIVIIHNNENSTVQFYINTNYSTYNYTGFVYTPNIFYVSGSAVTVMGFRVFNNSLTSSEIKTLYNGGRPSDYTIPQTGSLRESLVAEYIPSGIGSAVWVDNSNNNLDLTTGTAPTLEYTYPYYNENIIGSGAPTSRPNFIGQKFFDQSGGKIYMAKGTLSSDWVLIS
jgi:hypothetical protein